MTTLANLRRQRGLSQRALAARARISQSYLARLERGERIGPVRTYARLAAALGVPIQMLLPAEDDGEEATPRA